VTSTITAAVADATEVRTSWTLTADGRQVGSGSKSMREARTDTYEATVGPFSDIGFFEVKVNVTVTATDADGDDDSASGPTITLFSSCIG
jgi:hypothetical protein